MRRRRLQVSPYERLLNRATYVEGILERIDENTRPRRSLLSRAFFPPPPLKVMTLITACAVLGGLVHELVRKVVFGW